MVHTLVLAKALKGVKSKVGSTGDRIIDNINESVRKDMIRQRIKIEKKIRRRERLNEFEEWLIEQPEFVVL